MTSEVMTSEVDDVRGDDVTLVLLNLELPGAGGAPAGHHTEVLGHESLGVLPVHEGLALALAEDLDVAAEEVDGVGLLAPALVGRLHLDRRHLCVLADGGVLVLPAPQEDLVAGVARLLVGREHDVGVVVAGHAEGDRVAVHGLPHRVLQLVLRGNLALVEELEGGSGPVAGGVAEEAVAEVLWYSRYHEGLVLAPPAYEHLLVGERDPELLELVGAQDVWGVLLHQVVSLVEPDGGVLALPGPYEDLQHGVGRLLAAGEAEVGVVRRLHCEPEGLAAEGPEVVVLLIAGVVLWQRVHVEGG